MTKLESVAHYFTAQGLQEIDLLHEYFTDNFIPEYKLSEDEVVEACHIINCSWEDYCTYESGEDYIEPRKLSFTELKCLYEASLPERLRIQEANKAFDEFFWSCFER